MTLERASWIAAIVGTIFAIVWGIVTYIRPPEGPAPTAQPQPQATIKGNENIVIQGNNNSVISSSSAPPTKENFNPESALETLTTGMSRTALEAQFGPARFDDEIVKLAARDLIFVFPRFFLQAVISHQGKVIFYSVTTRSADFRPAIPKLDGRLLESHYKDLGNGEHIYSNMSSKFYEYAERIYLGNPGNYRNFYLGYCPAGILPGKDKFSPAVLDRDGPLAMKEFREKSTPNCFGVGDILGDEDRIFENIHMGIDYFIARDL